jgi:hypothetical protein
VKLCVGKTDQWCVSGYVENLSNAFVEMNDTPILYYLSVVIIFTAGGSFAAGLSVTKYASAGQRSVMILARTPIVWIISVILGWEIFVPEQIVGYLFVTIGTLMYNEFIVFDIDCLKRNTKAEILKRKQEEEIKNIFS